MFTTSIIPKKESEININKKHYALIYPKEFSQKPVNREVGKIHNHFKRYPVAQNYTLKEIVKAFASGQTLILSMVQRVLKNKRYADQAARLDPNTAEWANLHRLKFQSTQLIGIDIDDEFHQTNVQNVIEHFKGKVSAVYYSFSHGRKNSAGGIENRYRLLFQLDEVLTDYEVAKEFAILLREDFLQLYPNLPKESIDTMHPTTLWHGSRLAPVLIDTAAAISTKEYIERAAHSIEMKRKQREKNRMKRKESLKYNTDNPIDFDELVKMAEAIGHLETGRGEEGYNEWLSICLSIKEHEYSGGITEDEGLQLFNIISGGEASDEEYFDKDPHTYTIGTFIKKAIDSGYKPPHKYDYALKEVDEVLETECVKVDKYLSKELVVEWLQREEKLLIDSPTGSGKTTSIINAFKHLSSSGKFFIFTAPTVTLAEQVAVKHGISCIKGGINELKKIVISKIMSGERVFSCTYDKAIELINYIRKDIEHKTPPSFSIAIDEVHKIPQQYDFRYEAMKSLNEIITLEKSVLCLSGTIEDVQREPFDKRIKVDNGIRKSPNREFRVFTYDTVEGDERDPSKRNTMLLPVVRGLIHSTRPYSKVLLLINNKERIKTVAGMLRREGIKTATLTSDKRQSSTYLEIVEKEAFPKDASVLIATSVIADGVNLLHDSQKEKFHCVVVTDPESQFFNTSVIKQISNRFRNEYESFSLYMRTPNPDRKETRRFNVEAAYKREKKFVESYVNYLNEDFGDNKHEFIPSNVEEMHGIYYDNEKEEISFDPLFIRFKSVKKKDFYYIGEREAFINAVSKDIGHQVSQRINVNEHLNEKDLDFSEVAERLEAEKEADQLDAEGKRANFARYFTPEVHENLIYKYDRAALSHFGKMVHEAQYGAAARIARITDYETCKKICEETKRKSDMGNYSRDIKALIDINTFDYSKENQRTKMIFNELMKHESVFYVNAEFNEILKDISKRLKVTNDEIKATLKLFHRFSKRSKKERFTMIQPLTIELVASERYRVEPEAIKNSLRMFISTTTEREQKVMKKAMEKLAV